MLNWSLDSCFCSVVCGANFISDAPLTNSEILSESEPETKIYYLIKRDATSDEKNIRYKRRKQNKWSFKNQYYF